MSVKIARVTVEMMKVLEVRRARKAGGCVAEPVNQTNMLGGFSTEVVVAVVVVFLLPFPSSVDIHTI